MRLSIIFFGLGFWTYVEMTRQQAMIERSEYQPLHYGYFKIFFNHSLNVSHILSTISVSDYIECAFSCLQNVLCFSFNVASVQDINSNQYACQLLPTDKYRNLDHFAFSQEFHHYAIPNPCLTDPCPHSFICQVGFCDQGYRCVSVCNRSMGMESGEILDEQITASSIWDARHAAHQGRLNFQEVYNQNGVFQKSGSWTARINDENPWLQVDLLREESVVTSVATQGRNKHPNWGGHNQWVKTYKLQYSNNGVNFEYYKDQRQNSPKVFAGNYDRNSIVKHYLNPPIRARYIRFRPTDWNNYISMRVELYGC